MYDKANLIGTEGLFNKKRRAIEAQDILKELGDSEVPQIIGPLTLIFALHYNDHLQTLLSIEFGRVARAFSSLAGLSIDGILVKARTTSDSLMRQIASHEPTHKNDFYIQLKLVAGMDALVVLEHHVSDLSTLANLNKPSDGASAAASDADITPEIDRLQCDIQAARRNPAGQTQIIQQADDTKRAYLRSITSGLLRDVFKAENHGASGKSEHAKQAATG